MMPATTNDACAGAVLATVIVVNYNSLEHTDRCFRSLQSTLPEACEVILVDNASTDGSASYVAKHFPWVRIVALAANEGFAAANNRGAELARGRYVVALNPDTEVTEGWLQALLSPFTQMGHSKPVGITTPRILMMQEPDVVNTCGNSMHITGITVCRGLGQAAGSPELALSCEVSAVSGACFAMPRQLWLHLSGLDPDFFTYLEDTDLSLRARLAGYCCIYAPQAVVYHKYAASFSARKFYFLERNRPLMLAKCLQGRTLVTMLPIMLLAECIAWGYAVKSGRAHIAAKLGAYSWLVANVPVICRKRREVRSIRRVPDGDVISGMEWRLDMAQLAGPAIGRVAGIILNPLFRVWYWAAAGRRYAMRRESGSDSLLELERV